MKHSIIWLVCVGLLTGLSALYADNYIDDVYYHSKKIKAEKPQSAQPAPAATTPAKVVTTTTTTTPTTTSVQPHGKVWPIPQHSHSVSVSLTSTGMW